jgi:hypothetical protein
MQYVPYPKNKEAQKDPSVLKDEVDSIISTLNEQPLISFNVDIMQPASWMAYIENDASRIYLNLVTASYDTDIDSRLYMLLLHELEHYVQHYFQWEALKDLDEFNMEDYLKIPTEYEVMLSAVERASTQGKTDEEISRERGAADA